MRIPALEPFENGEQSLGVVTLEGRDSLVIAEQMAFEHQRDQDFKHIGNLADVLDHGEWVGKSLLLFARDIEGRLWLIDGQHRLRAHAEYARRSNSAAEHEWVVQVVSDIPPEEAYARLDAMQKKRPAAVVARALQLKVPAFLIKTCLSAAAYGIRYRSKADDKTEVAGSKVVIDTPYRDRRDYIHERHSAFEAAGKIMFGLSANDSRVRAAVASARILPICIETIMTSAEKATSFWRGVLRCLPRFPAVAMTRTIRARFLHLVAPSARPSLLVFPIAPVRSASAVAVSPADVSPLLPSSATNARHGPIPVSVSGHLRPLPCPLVVASV